MSFRIYGNVAFVDPSKTRQGTGESEDEIKEIKLELDNHIASSIVHGTGSNVVGEDDVQILTNKDLTDNTNSVRATELATNTGSVTITPSIPPGAGYALVTTSASDAQWAPIGGGGGGEDNTASSSGGESLVLTKVGIDLPFKGLAAGSTRINIDGTPATFINIDVNEANLTLDNMGGTVSEAQGGTGATNNPAAGQALIATDTTTSSWKSIKDTIVLQSNSLIVYSDTYDTVAYFAWDASKYDIFNIRNCIFYGITGNTGIDVQVWNETTPGPLGTGTMLALNSGENITFSFADPMGNALISVRIKKGSAAGVNPVIFGIQFEFLY